MPRPSSQLYMIVRRGRDAETICGAVHAPTRDDARAKFARPSEIEARPVRHDPSPDAPPVVVRPFRELHSF